MSKRIIGSLVISDNSRRAVFVPSDPVVGERAKLELPWSKLASESAQLEAFEIRFDLRILSECTGMKVFTFDAPEEELYKWFGCHQLWCTRQSHVASRSTSQNTAQT